MEGVEGKGSIRQINYFKMIRPLRWPDFIHNFLCVNWCKFINSLVLIIATVLDNSSRLQYKHINHDYNNHKIISRRRKH
jgi:hypothetical protein